MSMSWAKWEKDREKGRKNGNISILRFLFCLFGMCEVFCIDSLIMWSKCSFISGDAEPKRVVVERIFINTAVCEAKLFHYYCYSLLFLIIVWGTIKDDYRSNLFLRWSDIDGFIQALLLVTQFYCIENAFLFAKLRQFKLLIKVCERVWIEKLIKIYCIWKMYDWLNWHFFLKTPDIIFSVMQKPFKKCVFPMRVNRFLHIRKKLIRRLKKNRQ
jgi:hypothetical protein